jgi:hypothetical protein
MTTSQHDTARSTIEARPTTPRAAGELRQVLRERGWRADLAWVEVGSRAAAAAVGAADGAAVRRTIVYLPSLRALDGGALQLWREGDVPAPAVADVREVMVAVDGVDEWTSEAFEVPPARVEDGAEAEGAGFAA